MSSRRSATTPRKYLLPWRSDGRRPSDEAPVPSWPVPLEGADPLVSPPWVAGHLADGWRQKGPKDLWPVDVRAALASFLTCEGAPTVVMERSESRPGEDEISLFDRLSADTDAWLFYWPLGGRPGGRDFEAGFLGHALQRGEVQLRQLPLFPEKGVLRWDDATDRMIVAEKGNRHRFLSALVGREPPILRWSDDGMLFAKARRMALEFEAESKDA